MTGIELKKTDEVEAGLCGTVVYAVLVDGHRIGWVGDHRQFRGTRYGGRQWWACWREEGDSAAREDSINDASFHARKAAVGALLRAASVFGERAGVES